MLMSVQYFVEAQPEALSLQLRLIDTVALAQLGIVGGMVNVYTPFDVAVAVVDGAVLSILMTRDCTASVTPLLSLL